ncbi:TetR/AcrR family transcriptional regulator [Ktedonosporobacter rubrisoli]|uniref:TetR/AcrR family transcriptional regulator n=1 Tax=Ktedonosporobacter rubrisoli TaxID=2509675 RepID=A0A4V0YXZ9_KTERU|nr:TetR/AcrR family transcriptional regulator [Ktedonosporobacter rubrisoli]QBD74481.1 TetR/AcrR family transcriptional regulator [Ktedonosporobacter rubrisoli]
MGFRSLLCLKLKVFTIEFCQFLCYYAYMSQKDAQHFTEQGRVARRRARVRSALLAAARQILTTKGNREATISEIVQLADIATGTFYLHFRDKDELFIALIGEELEGAYTHLQTITADQPPGPAFSLAVRTVLTGAYQRLDLFMLGCAESSFAHALMHSIQAKLTELFVPMLREMTIDMQANDEDCELQAHLIVGMLVQAISWWFEHREPEPTVMAERLLCLLRQDILNAVNDDKVDNPATQ